MEFNEWLQTQAGKTLLITQDSRDYKKFKMIWDFSRATRPPEIQIQQVPIDVIVEVEVEKIVYRDKHIKKVTKKGKKQ